MIPLLIGLTIFMGLMGTNSINSDKYFQNHGVSLTSLSLPHSAVGAKADTVGDMLGQSIMGNIMNAVDNINDKVMSIVAPKDQDLPANSYGMRDAWQRVYGADSTSKSDANSVAQRIYGLRASNSIKSYTNGDIMSQITSALPKLGSLLGSMVLFILMAGATVVDGLGTLVLNLVGSLNIFKYIYNAMNDGAQSQDAIGQALQGFLDLWIQFKPIVMTIATLLFIFMIVRFIMGTPGSRGRIFGTGVIKYGAVFFAWGMLPFVLGGIISYGTTIATSFKLDDVVQQQIQSTFYNSKAPFAAAFYPLDPDTTPTGFVSENKGGIQSSDVYGSWSHNNGLGLNGSEWSAIQQWGSGDSFDADDVNALIGWNGDSSDSSTNKGYFSRKADDSGDSVKGKDDNGKSWAAAHTFLASKLGTATPEKGSAMPVVADKVLAVSGWDEDLFSQTAAGSKKQVKLASDRLRRLAMTHVIATWGINSSGRMQVNKQTGMNTSPKVQWNAVTLVGDTFVARFANWSEIVVAIGATVIYAITAYIGVIVVLSRTIGTALIDQFRATTGSVGAVARAILSAVMSVVIIAYIVVTVNMVAPMITAVDSLVRTIISKGTGDSGISNLTGQLVSVAVLWLGAIFVIKLFNQMRGALVDGMTSFVNQLAETIDRAMGVQPGADSSVAASMKRGTDDTRRTSNSAFRSMDKVRNLENSGFSKSSAGLKKASAGAATGLDKLAPAAELAAGAYAGPLAGKAAGLATKGAAGALKGVSKGADAINKVADADQISNDAGVGNTLTAMKNNGASAYGEARENGATRREALGAASKRGMATATGAYTDSGDLNADQPVESRNSFNQAVAKKAALASASAAKGQEKRDRQLQRRVADKTSVLTSQSNELTEALQEHGAAKFANSLPSGTDNKGALTQASAQLRSAKQSQLDAGTEKSEQQTVVRKARENVQTAKDELGAVKSTIRQQVANGEISKSAGNAAIQQASNHVSEAEQVYQNEKSTLNTLAKTQRSAERRVTEAQGAVNMVQSAIAKSSESAKFSKPAGMASSRETLQHVNDIRREIVKTQHDINRTIEKSNVAGADNASSSSITAGGTAPKGVARSIASSQTVTDTTNENRRTRRNSNTTIRDSSEAGSSTTTTVGANKPMSTPSTSVGSAPVGATRSSTTTQTVTDRNNIDRKTRRNSNTTVRDSSEAGSSTTTTVGSNKPMSASSTSRGNAPVGTTRSSATTQTVTDQNNINRKTRRNVQRNIVNETESVNSTIERAKKTVSNLEKTVSESKSQRIKSGSEAARAKRAVSDSIQRRSYDTKLRDQTNDTN